MDAKCSKCKQALRAETIAEMSGSSGDVRMTCLDLPCLVCPEGHEKRGVHPDVCETLLDELLRGEAIPLARQKGLFRKRWICPSCGNELQSEAGRPDSIEVECATYLNWRGASYELEIEASREGQRQGRDDAADHCFAIRIEAPMHQCLTCSRPSFLISSSTLTSPLRHSLIAAVEKAGLS
ncbi:MAG: hypothetical protein ACOC9P_01665 [bacterium]